MEERGGCIVFVTIDIHFHSIPTIKSVVGGNPYVLVGIFVDASDTCVRKPLVGTECYDLLGV